MKARLPEDGLEGGCRYDALVLELESARKDIQVNYLNVLYFINAYQRA